jgi:peptidoglycan/LPS O-acetylase OafA/YrhL
VALGGALLVLSYGIAAALFTWVEMPILRRFTRRPSASRPTRRPIPADLEVSQESKSAKV